MTKRLEPCARRDCRARLDELRLLRMFCRRLIRPLKQLALEHEDRILMATCIETTDVLDKLALLDPQPADPQA
jgi:hypothetical protein